jgi:hypothetical protein
MRETAIVRQVNECLAVCPEPEVRETRNIRQESQFRNLIGDLR